MKVINWVGLHPLQALILTGGCGSALGFIVGMVTLVVVWTAEDKQRRQRKLNPTGKSP